MSSPSAARAATVEDLTRASAVTVASSTATLRAYGAGVIVGISGTTVRVLTAKHVAVFGPVITIALDHRAPTLARLVYADPARDFAVLEATIGSADAAGLRAVPIGRPAATHAPLHVWGEVEGALELQRGDVAVADGRPLPDGAAAGRFGFTCAGCHLGDSGAGVFDANGTLVGLYLGYFVDARGRRGLSVAMLPDPVTAWANPALPATVADATAPQEPGPAPASVAQTLRGATANSP